jgi:hypothetical protein
MLLEDGEPLFSLRRVDEHVTRRLAENAKKDLLRTGWAQEVEQAINRGDGGDGGDGSY